MKRSFLILAAVAALTCGATLHADDAVEARKAFDLFVLYSKTGDEKMLDLFADDIVATFSWDTEKGAHDVTVPAAKFKETTRAGLAKKVPNNDTYEDVVCTQDGDLVRLTCSRIDGKSGVKSPFLLVYGKDTAGTLKIKALKIKVSPPKVTAGS